MEVDGKVRLILMAKKDISVGEELQYDYGVKDEKVLALLPWLRQ